MTSPDQGAEATDVRAIAPGLTLDLVGEARRAAERLLAEIDDGGRRWRHTRAVAARADLAAATLAPADADRLRAAAWLHDTGYAPSLNRFGFHPVDGAIGVRDHLAWPDVAGLVAHHSGARFIAQARGLTALLDPFDRTEFWAGPVADALTWADQTTGPNGQTVTVEERLRDMLTRHGPDSPNARSHAQRAPAIIAAVRATDQRIAAD